VAQEDVVRTVMSDRLFRPYSIPIQIVMSLMHQVAGILRDVRVYDNQHCHLALCSARIHDRTKHRLIEAGFDRDQYSDWVQLFTTGAHTYNTMTSLENTLPSHKLSSTVRRLRMNRIDEIVLLAETQLGGAFSTKLRGPVPSNLVAPVAAAMNPYSTY
jgi:hypothetical protein